MQIHLTKTEIKKLLLSLDLGIAWEDSCIDSYRVHYDKRRTKRMPKTILSQDKENQAYIKVCRRNISWFNKIRRKLVELYHSK